MKKVFVGLALALTLIVVLASADRDRVGLASSAAIEQLEALEEYEAARDGGLDSLRAYVSRTPEDSPHRAKALRLLRVYGQK